MDKVNLKLILSSPVSVTFFYSKISAHEFERGGLLKPIVNTIDGTPTFLSVDVQNESQCLSGGVGHHATTNGGCGSTSGTFAGSSSSHSGAGGNNCGGSSTLPSTLGVNLTAAGRPQRLSRNELKQLDERELIFELVGYRNRENTEYQMESESTNK